MSLEQSVNELVNVLKNAVRDGSLGTGTARLNDTIVTLNKTEAERLALQQKITKAEKDMARDSQLMYRSFKGRLDKFAGNLELSSNLITNAFTNAAEALDYDNFELLPTAMQAEFAKAGDVVKQLGVQAGRSAADMLTVNQHIDEMTAILEEHKNATEWSAEATEKLSQIADHTGVSFAELADDASVLQRNLVEANEARAELTRKMRGGEFGDFADTVRGMSNKLAQFGVVVSGLTHAFGEAARPAFRFGTEIGDSLTAFMAGMNPEEMAQNMAEYRQTINASGMGMDGFRDVTEKGTLALSGWTGELRDAVRVQASAFGMAQRFGAANQSQIQSFMDTQVRTFKQFNSVFSMTAEEFVAMNKQLESSQSVNEQIYRLNRQQRVQHAQEIQQTVLRLRTMGLMQEQAMKVVDAMAAIGAKSPKERMKEAAKLQAVGGALGFGQAAEEMATIMRRGMRGEGDYERFAELQKEAQSAVGAKMGQGFASEMMTAQMLESTGLEQLLGPKSDFADLNTEQYKAIQNLEDHATQQNEYAAKAIGIIDMIQSLLAGPIVKALGVIAGAVAMAAGGSLLQSAAASLLGGGGLKAIFGTILRFIGPAGIVASIIGMVGHAMADKKDKAVDYGTSAELEALKTKRRTAIASEMQQAMAAAEDYMKKRGTQRDYGMQYGSTWSLGPLSNNALRTASGEAYEGKMGSFTHERASADLEVALKQMETDRKTAAGELADAQKEGDKEKIKIAEDHLEVMKENLKMLEELSKRNKNIEDGIVDGNTTAEEQLKEAKKANSTNNNTLRWTLAG